MYGPLPRVLRGGRRQPRSKVFRPGVLFLLSPGCGDKKYPLVRGHGLGPDGCLQHQLTTCNSADATHQLQLTRAVPGQQTKQAMVVFGLQGQYVGPSSSQLNAYSQRYFLRVHARWSKFLPRSQGRPRISTPEVVSSFDWFYWCRTLAIA